jgi:hypothetical protein
MNWMERDEEHRPLAPPIELYSHLVAHLASLGFGTEAVTEDPTKDADYSSREEPGVAV